MDKSVDKSVEKPNVVEKSDSSMEIETMTGHDMAMTQNGGVWQVIHVFPTYDAEADEMRYSSQIEAEMASYSDARDYVKSHPADTFTIHFQEHR